MFDRCVATGTALCVSSYILFELSMGNFDLVICFTSHFEGLKVICQDCAQLISLSRSCCMLFWSVCLVIFIEKEEEGAKIRIERR